MQRERRSAGDGGVLRYWSLEPSGSVVSPEFGTSRLFSERQEVLSVRVTH